jgi:hypothetical protein
MNSKWYLGAITLKKSLRIPFLDPNGNYLEADNRSD